MCVCVCAYVSEEASDAPDPTFASNDRILSICDKLLYLPFTFTSMHALPTYMSSSLHVDVSYSSFPVTVVCSAAKYNSHNHILK